MNDSLNIMRRNMDVEKAAKKFDSAVHILLTAYDLDHDIEEHLIDRLFKYAFNIDPSPRFPFPDGPEVRKVERGEKFWRMYSVSIDDTIANVVNQTINNIARFVYEKVGREFPIEMKVEAKRKFGPAPADMLVSSPEKSK